MRWHNVSAKQPRLYVYLIPLAFLASALCHAPNVAAEDTEVSVAICTGTNAGASIDITQPNDDSIVNQSITTFRGNITNVTQIDVEVDGQYVSTIPIGSNDTTFITDVSLSPGTHTLVFIANDVCQNSNDSASIVITYQPDTEPSDGGTTPTDVEGSGIVTDEESGIKNEDKPIPIFERIRSIPVVGSIAEAIRVFSNAIGINETVKAGVGVGAARITLTLAAASLVVYGGSIAPMLVNVSSFTEQLYTMNKHRFLAIGGWVLRLASIGLFALAYSL